MQTAATPSRTTERAFPLRYFVLAFAITWFFWGLGVLGERGVIPTLPGFTVIGTFGPMVAAVILTAQEGGRTEVRSLLGRIVRWRVAPVWYGVAIVGPLVLTLAAIALHVALGGQTPGLGALIGALPTVIFVSVYMLIFVALGEKVGWRGYALPALQARHGAFVASVILGAMWALWHVPQFFNPATLYSDLPFVLFLAYLIPFSVLITWVFNSTVVSPFTSISAYLIPGHLPAMVLVAPLAHLFGLWESPVFYLIPTHGSLLLLGDAFGTLRLSTWQQSYAVLYQLLWVGGLALLARGAFDRYVVPKGG